MRFGAGSIRIEPLGADHDRPAFDCGNRDLNGYIRDYGRQDVRRGVARIFVAVAADHPSRILGFFTLSAASVAAADLPSDVAKRLPRYPVPAALIGRLAVDQTVARRGLGGILLADAIQKAATAAVTLAITVVVVDPIDNAAQEFYAAFGFRDLLGARRRMFLVLPRR